MRILVALDGSALAEHALAAVAPMASAGEVILMQVIDPDDIHATLSTWDHRVREIQPVSGRLAIRGAASEPARALAEDRGQALEAARNHAESQLRDAAVRWLPADTRWSVHVGWSGSAADEIAAYAKECGANLVAVGTHGRSGLSQVLLGSVASALVRRCPVPLLVVSESMTG